MNDDEGGLRVSHTRMPEQPQNNKMQRTKHGQNGASPLILVFAGRPDAPTKDGAD